jgi:hypothetical protein
MSKLLKWQIAELEAIKRMSNEELLEETIGLAGGDDYDGCFTSRGDWRFAELQFELHLRLRAVGYLENE